jgi:hypothetical protein
MKKTIILSILTILSHIAFAQINITGATTYSGSNQTYYLNQNYAYSQIQNYVAKDVNTNSFFFDASANDKYWIVRKNNKWLIERVNMGMAIYPLYVSNTTSNEQNPPCNIVWQVWSGLQFEYGDSRAYTGNNESQIVLAGSCVCVSMLSATINPTNIQLPILNNTDFSTFSNPHKGMLSYNTSLNNIPVVYDGTSWNEIILNKNGAVNITGSLNLPIVVNNIGSTATLGVSSNTFINNSSVNVALSIPNANTCAGRQYLIVNHGSGTITLSFSVKLSYASSTTTIASGASFTIVSDGANWHKVN